MNSLKIASSTEAKMSVIANELLAKTKTLELPFLTVVTTDYLGSSIRITGSFDYEEAWLHGYLENSRYFIVDIAPHSGKWDYCEGEKVMMKLIALSCKIKEGFQKYTGTPDSVVSRLINWIELVS